MKRILFAFMILGLGFTYSIFFFLLFGYSLAIAHPVSNSCFEKDSKLEEEPRRPLGAEELRLNELFIIGEKAIGFRSKEQPRDEALITKEGKIYGGIRKTGNFGIINAFSILDVKLRNEDWVIPILEEKKYNILIVAELKKKGESTWSRISIINKYTWEIKKGEEILNDTTSQNETSYKKRLRPFYVANEILTENPFLREGDKVIVLFFYDIEQPPVYLNDLKETQQKGRSLLTINSQEMYLITSGVALQKYSAKEGDEIRLRFMRADYPIKRKEEVEKLRNEGKWPKPPMKYGDIVSVEDEMYFIFKEFGIKLNVSPVLTFGCLSNNYDADEFNPMKKNASLGSNVYLSYDGRNNIKKFIFNYLMPGIHFSLLDLLERKESKFTFGFVLPLLPHIFNPKLRGYFGLFYGWYNLKNPVWGVTFSPIIDFKTLVRAEEKKK